MLNILVKNCCYSFVSFSLESRIVFVFFSSCFRVFFELFSSSFRLFFEFFSKFAAKVVHFFEICKSFRQKNILLRKIMSKKFAGVPDLVFVLCVVLLFYVSYCSSGLGLVGFDTRSAIRGAPSPARIFVLSHKGRIISRPAGYTPL